MTVNESRLAVIRQASREPETVRAAANFHKLTYPPHWFTKKTPHEIERVYKDYAKLYGLFDLLSDRLFELGDYLGDLEYSINESKKCVLVPQNDGSEKEGDTA